MVRTLHLLVVFMVFGCSSKSDFILFNKTDINYDKNITVTTNNSITKNSIENINGVDFEYKIVPDDRVSVIIYKHPEFSTSSLENRFKDRGILVNSKGYIRLPLIKSIHIAGLTQEEALNKIETAFDRYIISPDVYLEVLNKRAYVIGEVKNPGEITLPNEKTTLIKALAKAGDLLDSADKRGILLLRKEGSTLKRYNIDLTNRDSLTTANLMIKPNDIIYIMPNNSKSMNVKIKEINPIFSLISNILSPFVSIKYLSN